MSKLRRRAIIKACNTIECVEKEYKKIPAEKLGEEKDEKEEKNESLKGDFMDLVHYTNKDLKTIAHNKIKLKERKKDVSKKLIEYLYNYFPTDDIDDEDIFNNMK
jgi:hypothetical protein